MPVSSNSASILSDVVIVGGGQSALATGYFLRRAGINYAVADDQPAPGGA